MISNLNILMDKPLERMLGNEIIQQINNTCSKEEQELFLTLRSEYGSLGKMLDKSNDLLKRISLRKYPNLFKAIKSWRVGWFFNYNHKTPYTEYGLAA